MLAGSEMRRAAGWKAGRQAGSETRRAAGRQAGGGRRVRVGGGGTVRGEPCWPSIAT